LKRTSSSDAAHSKRRPPGAAAKRIRALLEHLRPPAFLPAPESEPVRGADMPEPYRSLLVHRRDMTPTLERFHGDSIHIEVLSRQLKGNLYSRDVVLFVDETHRAVLLGAIRIHLARFPAAAREMIREEHMPLGHILWTCGVRHTSRPRGFFRIEADLFIQRALRIEGRPNLYGRENVLLNPAGLPLAEIVEILPLA
jgi:hypothetical protein